MADRKKTGTSRKSKGTRGKPQATREAKVKFVSEEEADQLGIDEGSKSVKRLAAKQKINVKLTRSQMEAIRAQLKRWDNKKPAEITFLVEKQPEARFRVAAYAYRKKTCCA